MPNVAPMKSLYAVNMQNCKSHTNEHGPQAGDTKVFNASRNKND